MAAIRACLLILLPLPVVLAAAQDAAESRDAADTIRILRLQSNEAFAAHDVAAIVSFLDEDYQITTSVGAIPNECAVGKSLVVGKAVNRPSASGSG